MTYSPPTPAQVREFLRAHSLTGSQAAGLAGLFGSNKVRAYTGGANPHRVSYAIWFTWHAKQVIDAETLAKIEKLMEGTIS